MVFESKNGFKVDIFAFLVENTYRIGKVLKWILIRGSIFLDYRS
jgi:hypothetical protein